MTKFTIISFLSLLLFIGCGSKKALVTSELSYAKRKIFEQQFFEAQKQKALNNKEKALNLFKQSLETYPQSSVCMYEVAKLYYQLEKYNDAMYWAKQAVDNSNDFNHWYSGQLAQFYNKFGKYQESAEVFAYMVEKEPENKDNYLEAANQYYNAKEFGKSINQLLKMQSVFGVEEASATRLEFVYRNTGQPDKAIDAIHQLCNAFPNEVSYKGYLVDAYVRADRTNDAKNTLREIIKADSTNGRAYFMLYNIYNKEGNDELAFLNLRKAFKSNDVGLFDKLQSVSVYFLKINKDEKTKNEITELSDILIELYPTSPEPFVLKSDISNALNDYESARNYIKKAIEINQGDFKLWVKLLKLDEKLHNNNFQLEDAEKAISLYPSIADLYRAKAYALYNLNRYEEAINTADIGLEVAIEKQDKVSLKMCKALCYTKLSNSLKSDKLYSEVLLIDPYNAIALNNYASNLASRGERIDEADSMIHLALKLDNTNSSFYDTKAWILYHQQKYNEALDWLNNAIAMDPRNRDYYVHAKAVYQKLGNQTLANQMQQHIDQLSIEIKH